jgi:NAD(P)-dependent dehydrogenase (short-subunit alcohol dehydrogenase family)
MIERLQGKRAVVTGSTDGIGVAIAGALAAQGAHVLVCGRNKARGDEVVETIRQAGGAADFVAADLASGLAGVTQIVGEAERLMPGHGIDILINNAAMLIDPGPTSQVSEDLIDQALATNIKAAFLLTGLVAPGMVERGSGVILNIGSINGLIGMAGSALYSLTKAALHSLTKSWAAEFGPAGVRVNTIAPGPTATPRVQESALIQEHLVPILAGIPTRRAGTPEEVAAAVVFLASDDARNITGATLSVDGGLSAV